MRKNFTNIEVQGNQSQRRPVSTGLHGTESRTQSPSVRESFIKTRLPKMPVLWVVKPCSLVEFCRCFRGVFYPVIRAMSDASV
jgi:hypothetical protein